jgi:hypothetical protein
MKTLKQFVAESHISESLIRAVVRQSGGWEAFTEHAADVMNHGADGGYHGFIYYAETVSFAKRQKAVILEMARQMADDLGEPGAYSMIAGFNCLRDMGMTVDTVADAVNSAKHEDHTSVMNSLAWYALEEVSRSYADR